MSVFGLVSAIAGFVKVRFLEDKEVIDNAVFRCHYRITSAILFVCCILCTANSLIGNPIDCLSSNAFKDKEKVINTYCWITSTFSFPERKGSIPAIQHLGPHNDEDEPVYHSYYQWVPFVLFLQGIFFYIPHWVWKNWEEGKIKKISEGLRGATMHKTDDKSEKQSKLVDYLMQSLHLHESYAITYFFCEILNFVNVIGNIFFLDKFLGGVFLEYGTDVLSYSSMDQEDRTDPMVEIFPRLTKCTFHKFGSSGTIETHDALCVLPLNILNEKIFIFLWFWFIILAVMTGLALCYSMLLAALPQVRKFIIERRFKYRTPGGITALINKIKVGDFLILHLLGQNMSAMTFHDMMQELISKLNNYSTFPSAPSTLEMRPIYPSKELFAAKDTEE